MYKGLGKFSGHQKLNALIFSVWQNRYVNAAKRKGTATTISSIAVLFDKGFRNWEIIRNRRVKNKHDGVRCPEQGVRLLWKEHTRIALSHNVMQLALEQQVASKARVNTQADKKKHLLLIKGPPSIAKLPTKRFAPPIENLQKKRKIVYFLAPMLRQTGNWTTTDRLAKLFTALNVRHFSSVLRSIEWSCPLFLRMHTHTYMHIHTFIHIHTYVNMHIRIHTF